MAAAHRLRAAVTAARRLEPRTESESSPLLLPATLMPGLLPSSSGGCWRRAVAYDIRDCGRPAALHTSRPRRCGGCESAGAGPWTSRTRRTGRAKGRRAACEDSCVEHRAALWRRQQKALYMVTCLAGRTVRDHAVLRVRQLPPRNCYEGPRPRIFGRRRRWTRPIDEARRGERKSQWTLLLAPWRTRHSSHVSAASPRKSA